jgi:hypothetical protein
MYSALLKKTRDYIRENLLYKGNLIEDGNCDVTIDGRPVPTAPEMFVAVTPTGWLKANESPGVLSEKYEFECVVSLKLNATPNDRYGDFFLDQVKGIEKVCRDLILLLHLNYVVIANANNEAAAAACTKIFTPPQWQETTDPEVRYDDWYYQLPGQFGDRPAPVAMIMRVKFGEIERAQKISGAT